MNIQLTLKESLTKAVDEWMEKAASERAHHAMSSTWVETLASAFRTYYQNDHSVRVFSKGFQGNASEFGLNELLYDILVCRAEGILSAKQGKRLQYFSECIWQVESELARDSRDAMLDFNKLVIGGARKKLFIGPLVDDPLAYLDVLLPAAKVCSGDVYVALIPHPEVWSAGKQSIRLWELDGQWRDTTEE
jgi:hypothetical protein